MEYKIIGGDGVEYGPVSLDEIQAWIREGRVGRNTLVSSSDTKVWTPAANIAELQQLLTELYGDKAVAHEQTFDSVGFWPRFGAYLVDRVVVGVLFYAAWELLTIAFDIRTPQQPPVGTSNEKLMEFVMAEYLPFIGWQLAVYLPVHIAYEVSLNGRFGATLGKMIVGARIVRIDGKPFGYGTALLRWFAERLSDLACYIGYLFIAFRDDKRGMHDLIVGTRVVYRR